MSELPISSKYRSRPDEPVSDAERDQLSRRLNAAFTDGALDQDGYARRLDQLFAAKTMGELVAVVEGLPPAQTYQQPNIVASTGPTSAAPGELTPARSGNRAAMVAVGSISVIALLLVILLIVLL